MMLDKSAWQAGAYYSARRVIASKFRTKGFTAEDVLQEVVKDIGFTSDFRAFGNVIQSLHSDGLIYKDGYRAAKSSNYSAKPIWRKSAKWGR